MTDLTFNIAWATKNAEALDAISERLVKIGDRLDELDHKKADPKVDVDTSQATRKLDELDAKLKATDAAASKAGGGGGGGGGMGALIAGAIGVGAGPLAGGALLAIPAVITAIGVAAEKSNVQVDTAFTGLTTAAKTSLQAGFSPFVPTLVAIANQAKTTVTGLTPDFAAASAAAAPLLQTVSTGLLKAAQDGVSGTAAQLQRLDPVAGALSDDFGKLEQGVGGFVKNLDVNAAAQGLQILGTDLQQILPAVGSLVSEVMPLGNAILQVLGPALRDTGTDLQVLNPLISAASGLISFLGPDIAAFGGPAAAMLGLTKLLTGSWTDFSGAVSKIKSVLQDADGEFDRGKSTLDSLAKIVGINTQSARDAALADAKFAADKASVTAAAKAQALADAQSAVAADNSAKNRVALREAELAQAAAAREATAAEDALSAASEASVFSFGPLGIAIAAAGALLLPFIASDNQAASATQDLTADLVKLAQSAPDAAAGIVAGNGPLSDLINKAGAAGLNVKDMLAAYAQGPDALQAFTDALNQQHESLGNTTVGLRQAGDGYVQASGNAAQTWVSIKDLTDQVNRHDIALSGLPQHVQGLVNAYNAQNDVQKQLGTSVSELTQQQQAQNAIVNAASPTQQQAAATANALGLSISAVAASYADYASGTKYALSTTQQMTDTVLGQILAVGQANSTVSNYFKQADQAVTQATQSVTDANHAYQQSITAVSDAEHAAVQAAQAVTTAKAGVVTAIRAVADAEANELIAENNVAKAQTAATQAQTALNTARQTAIEQLKTLQLQLADQVASEREARLALFDQTQTSAALGVTPDNAAAVADEPITAANEAKIKAANDLLKAQQALNDTLNTGANLREQVTAADQAGVDGAPGVLSAEQALANANDQVAAAQQARVKAQQAVTDAQANVLKAEQGVTDAEYNEQKAHLAVSDALYNKKKAMDAVGVAQAALAKAQDDASRSMDANTQAGQRNLAMLKQVADQLAANENPQQAGNDLINNTATLFDITTTAAQGYLTKLGLIPPNFQFGVTAVGQVDLSALPNWAQTNAVLSARQNNKGHMAGGGPVVGPGGPRDDLIPIMVSNREFVQPVDSVDHYGLPFMEAVRQKTFPRFAAGGLADSNVFYGAVGIDYQDVVNTLGVMGLPTPTALPSYAATAAAGISGGTADGGVTRWAPTILQALALVGQPASWLPTVERRMNQESGGNPTVVNTWDSNWAKGTPSVGLMQVIGPTYHSNAGPFLGTGPFEYGVSVDPLANTYAGLHYALGRYHTLAALDRPGGYAGGGLVALKPPKSFDSGNTLDPGWNLAWNGTGAPEPLRPAGQDDALLAELRSLGARLDKLGAIHVHPPAGASVDQVADAVMRRLRFRGRG